MKVTLEQMRNHIMELVRRCEQDKQDNITVEWCKRLAMARCIDRCKIRIPHIKSAAHTRRPCTSSVTFSGAISSAKRRWYANWELGAGRGRMRAHGPRSWISAPRRRWNGTDWRAAQIDSVTGRSSRVAKELIAKTTLSGERLDKLVGRSVDDVKPNLPAPEATMLLLRAS